MIILRQQAFSEIEQKEFNSKAAKALNNKYLRQIEPELWLRETKSKAREKVRFGHDGKPDINRLITNKASTGSASNRDFLDHLKVSKKDIRHNRGYGPGIETYDHSPAEHLFLDKEYRKSILKNK